MPLFKVIGRHWVALHLADFLDTGAKAQAKSRDGGSGNGNEGLKRSAVDLDVRGTREVEGKSPWGVVGITNREGAERRDSLTAASSSLSITLPSAPSDPTLTSGLSPSPHRGGAGMGMGTGIGGALWGKEEGDFSVPVGVSSKRRRMEEEWRPLSRISSLELDSHASAHDQHQQQEGEDKDKTKWTPGSVAGVGSFVGFAMPTGLGVSSSKKVVGKKDNSLSARERDAMRTEEREGGRSGERRLLYEESVRHTTLALDMSLSHIHKFVGHRYDHDMYTQVRHDISLDALHCTALHYGGLS